MKKLICMLLCVIFILCGCGSKTAETEVHNVDDMTQPAITLPTETGSNDLSVITIGNIKFTLPDDFIVYSNHKNSCAFMSDDTDCDITLSAFDVSPLTEESVMDFLPDIHSKFISPNEIRQNETDINIKIASFPVIVDCYGDSSDIDNTTVKMNTTFTDSWYSYTITYCCKSDSEKVKVFSTAFGEMLVHSEYIGDTPRFDYIQ